MNHSLQQELVDYFDKLSEAEQLSVLQLIKTIATDPHHNWSPESIEVYNKELDEAVQAIENGGFITHEEVVATLMRRKQ